MNNEPENLMEATLNEIERVTKAAEIYRGFNIHITASMMESDVQEAKRCIANQDTVGLISVYQKLTEWQL